MNLSPKIDFYAEMEKLKEQQPPFLSDSNIPPEQHGAPISTSLTTLRYFTDKGIVEVEKLLGQIRSAATPFKEEVEELLFDPQFTRELKSFPTIDRNTTFNSKLDLCNYFIPLFGRTFLEQNRKNSGLWTWIAMTFYKQFIKNKKDTTVIASNARWIFDPENYRLSVRHFIAGPLYLNHDFYETSDEVKDMLFGSSVKEFGGFVDAITYKMEGTRMPVVMQVAAWLYYDKDSSTKVKKGAISQDKPGTVREFLRVVSQFAQTRDFFGVEDAQKLWDILPGQFNFFKKFSNIK